jgi:hypothetical protein
MLAQNFNRRTNVAMEHNVADNRYKNEILCTYQRKIEKLSK